MGYPVAYLSGNTTTYETGMFKRGTIGQNQAAALTGSYRWWNGIDVTSSQYLIYSDTFTTSASTAANATPAAWSTPDLTDQSLLNLINTLPERVGKLPFTYLPVALQWIQSTGRYFLLKNGYENIVTNGLLFNLDAGWYLSYSGTGTTWKDLSTNSKNGTLINGPTFSNGFLSFDGSDDTASLGTVGGYSNKFTCEAWFKTTSGAQWKDIICGGCGDIIFTINSNKVNFGSQCSNPIPHLNYSNTIVNTGDWFFASATYDAGVAKVYINGILENTYTRSDASQTPGNLFIGSSGGVSEFFNGTLGNVRLYDKALNPTEVAQNFNAQKTRFGLTADTISTSGLIMNLDAGNVISYPTTGTSWYDLSYNNYNGTLNNGPTYDSTYGGSIVFDGADDYVNLPNGLLSGTGDFTIIQWVQSNGGGVGTTFANYPSGNLQFGWSNNYVFLWLNNSSAYASTSYFTTGTTMISGRRIGTVTNYLKNGVVISTGSSSSTIGTSSSNFRMGLTTNGGEQYNGKIYRTIVYNRGLSDSEILQIYNSQKSKYGL